MPRVGRRASLRRVDSRPKSRVARDICIRCVENIISWCVGYMYSLCGEYNILVCGIYMYSLCGEYNILVCGIYVFAVWRI